MPRASAAAPAWQRRFTYSARVACRKKQQTTNGEEPDDADEIRFGPNGEWAEGRVLEVQFQNVKGNDVDQFKDPKVEVVLFPSSRKSGDIIEPYTEAKK